MLIDLCGRNGLRPAEARALRWQDLDLDQGLLEVTGQMDRTNTRGPVKRAANAARTIAIDQATITRLKQWTHDRSALQADARSAWTEQGFVAVGSIGQPIGREQFAIEMRRLCAEAEIHPHVTPYELRHTAISLQADAGQTSWEISDWAGTSEAMISSRYRHRIRRVSRILPADRLGGRWTKQRSGELSGWSSTEASDPSEEIPPENASERNSGSCNENA